MGAISQLQQIGIGAAASGAVSSGVSGFGQYVSGQEQKAAYDYNAQVTLQKMDEQEQTTEAEYSQLIGKQAAAYAAAGVDIKSGSPLLIMAHTAAQNAIQQTSENEAGTEEAELDRYYGKVAAFQGTVGGISTFLSGLSKGISGVGSILGPSSNSIPTVPNSMFGSM
jgi:hypothetical protein